MKRLWVIVAVGCAALVLCSVLCCGGLTYFGMNIVAGQVRVEMEKNPRLLEHVGELQEFKLNWAGSFTNEDDDVFVYNVKGSKGTGTLTAKHISVGSDKEEMVWAKLALPSGQTVDLVP